MRLIRKYKKVICLVFGILLFVSAPGAASLNISGEQKPDYSGRISLGSTNDKTSVSSRKGDLNSVLGSGKWYKIAITETGIYKLDYNFLKNAGIDIAGVNPSKLKIYGNGGKMLPQPNSTPRPVDLTENAIFINGEADGKFDAGDFILFYGQSPHTLTYNPAEINFLYSSNIYSDTSFYFLNIDGEAGKRLGVLENAGVSHPVINEYNDCVVYEKDLLNLLQKNGNGSGREWLGEVFDYQMSQDFRFSVPGIVPGSAASLIVSSLSYNSYATSSFLVSCNGSQVGEQQFNPVRKGEYELVGVARKDTFKTTISATSAEITVNLNFRKSSNAESKGYLDFLALQVRRKIQLNGNFSVFRSPVSQPSTIEITQFTNDAAVWDVTDIYAPKIQVTDAAGSVAKFGTTGEGFKEFVVFRPSQAAAPIYKGSVVNQDLRGSSSPDMIIVSYPAFKSEAERLAEFRRTNDNLDVQVVTTTEIFNEFASGAPDVTAIRDFVRLQHQKNESGLKYLLLLGKASFDYKNRMTNNTNFVPIYQSRNSLHPVYSYSSDDYYGFMEEGEGEWVETYDATGDHSLDLGIGRLPVASLAEAKAVVDKIIHYSSSLSTLGKWRNHILLVADDGDNNTHQRHAERFGVYLDTAFSQFIVNKLYTDAFPQTPIPSGEISEKGTEVLNDYIKKGCLIINYTGHGGDDSWTQEELLTPNVMKKWKNIDKLPLIVTATCEFGRHDSPVKVSGAEALVKKVDGGAIAMLTTSRPVYSNTNFELNRAFYNTVFKKVDGRYQAIGEVVKQTKNNSLSGSVNRNFILLGDPSLTLAYPKENIFISTVNERSVKENPDTLRALSEITLTGYIADAANQLLSQYNGTVYIDVYDKETEVETLGDEDLPMLFNVRNILYRGKSSIEDGVFTFQFFLPKNISYLIQKGKINMYATQSGSLTDASGFETGLAIGGSNKNPAADKTGPQIFPYLNDTTFKNGGISISSPILIAKLTDEHGINISGNSIGQEIRAILDNEKEYFLNDFYEAEENNYRAGWVYFPLGELARGKHSMKIIAWDSYNNPGESLIEFSIGDSSRIILLNVHNFPNPLQEETTFRFEHNRQGEDLQVEVHIFSVQGEQLETLTSIITDSFSVTDAGNWDGKKAGRTKLKEGIYIYRLKVRSLSDGARGEATKRLIIH